MSLIPCPLFGSLDPLGQMRVFISEEGIRSLRETRRAYGALWNSDRKLFPLRMYVREDSKAAGIPVKKPYEEKRYYVIHIVPHTLSRISDGMVCEYDMINRNVHFRKVCMSRDDVF